MLKSSKCIAFWQCTYCFLTFSVTPFCHKTVALSHTSHDFLVVRFKWGYDRRGCHRFGRGGFESSCHIVAQLSWDNRSRLSEVKSYEPPMTVVRQKISVQQSCAACIQQSHNCYTEILCSTCDRSYDGGTFIGLSWV